MIALLPGLLYPPAACLRRDRRWRRRPEDKAGSGPAWPATGGWSAAMAAKSWMSLLRPVASQARQTWLGGMSLT